MVKRRLYVCIPCRDRIILTQKCIESIWETTKLFNEIFIYVFDNKSDLDGERFIVFQNLLKNNQIQYYSYDTSHTMFNCFGKSVVFQRWIEMMKIQKEVRDHQHMDKEFQHYYMLVDNDFIFGLNWDSYFITTADNIKIYNPETHFIVKYPSGIHAKTIDTTNSVTLNNNFNNRSFKIYFSSKAGSSGMWFMTYEMLELLKWNYYHFSETFNVNKRHDTGTWSIIQKEKGKINYVTAIIPPNDERLLIHLGGEVGSLCNKLQSNQYNEEFKKYLKEKEKELAKMNVYQIFEKYKEKFHRW